MNMRSSWLALLLSGVFATTGATSWTGRATELTWVDLVPSSALALDPFWAQDEVVIEMGERVRTGNVSAWTVDRLVDRLVVEIETMQDGQNASPRDRAVFDQIGWLVGSSAWPTNAWRRASHDVPDVTPEQAQRLAVALTPLLHSSRHEVSARVLLRGIGPDARPVLPAMLRRLAEHGAAVTPGMSERQGRLDLWALSPLCGWQDTGWRGGQVYLPWPEGASALERAASMLEGDVEARRALETALTGDDETAASAAMWLLSLLAPILEPPPQALYDLDLDELRPKTHLDDLRMRSTLFVEWSDSLRHTLEQGLAHERGRPQAIRYAMLHGARAESLRPTLRALRDDRALDVGIRGMAAAAAVAAGDDPASAHDLLVPMVTHETDGVLNHRAFEMLETLGQRLGMRDPEMVRVVRAMLEEERWRRTTGRIELHLILLGLGDDPAFSTRGVFECLLEMQAQWGRFRIGSSGGSFTAINRGLLDPVAAAEFLDQPNDRIRQLAAAVIWYAGPDGAAALPRLRALRTTSSGAVRDDVDACIRLIETRQWPAPRPWMVGP